MPALEIRDLSYSAGGRAILKDVSMTVPDGALTVLCGPSGAGKTTLLRVLTGEVDPSGGDVLVDGVSVLDVPMRKRGIVLVDQQDRLFPHMTVRENVAFPMKIRRLSRAERAERLESLARRFHLESQMDLYPSQLSGGQRKLAAIMRALAAEPQALLLDEPFNGMDNPLHMEIRAFLSSLQREQHLTVLLVTHSKEDAFTLGDRIGFLFGGEMRLCRARGDVLSHISSVPDVEHFLGPVRAFPDGSWVFSDKLMQDGDVIV
ncbi:MAG: ATP-binding cassette domain-containing protein [Clostridia bacterium]|nr:ATP-binding cassette domain-containing protein [Clostridia bacterium]